MYLSHYGLHEPPFRITPVTDFFYGGANRAAILEALIYAITRGEGIIKVVGEVGSGKTMMCRVLMERLPENVDTIYLADPSLSREEIVYAIADELGLDLSGQRATVALRALQETLIQRFSAGRRVVLLVDEAHAMPVPTLEELRLLSNLETRRDKLLQIVLFGQPELDDNLRLPQLRQLRDRIIHNFNMGPLEQDAVKDYIAFRMRAAGYKGPDIFSPGALRLISRASRGLTRRINILADKALLAAFVANTHGVEPRHVRKAIRDCEFDLPRRPLPVGYPLAALALAAMAAGGLALQFAGRAPGPPAASQAAAPDASPPVAPAAAGSEPAPAPQAVPRAAVAGASGPGAAPPPEAAPTSAPEGESAQRAAAPSPEPAGSAPPAGAAPQAPARPTEQSPPAADDGRAGTVAEEESGNFSLLRQRLAATREMMDAAPGERFTIHLFYTDDAGPERIEAFLDRASRAVDFSRIYVLSARSLKRSRFRVFYGSYPSRDEASAALAGLPAKYHRDFRLQISTLAEMRRST
jgi:MSHA biogenesis protein MshM